MASEVLELPTPSPKIVRYVIKKVSREERYHDIPFCCHVSTSATPECGPDSDKTNTFYCIKIIPVIEKEKSGNLF